MEKFEAVARVCIEVSQALLIARVRPMSTAESVVLEAKLSDAVKLLNAQGTLGLPPANPEAAALGMYPPVDPRALTAAETAEKVLIDAVRELDDEIDLDEMEEGDAPGPADRISEAANRSDPDNVS